MEKWKDRLEKIEELKKWLKDKLEDMEEYLSLEK
jgi:hypothetical protein